MVAHGFASRAFYFIYKRFGAGGLLCLPFFTLTTEKICYDTFQAFRGHDIYKTGPKENAGGGFPSGGSELPSFSLIPVQKWGNNVVNTIDTSNSGKEEGSMDSSEKS